MNIQKEIYNVISECCIHGGIYIISADFDADETLRKFAVENACCSILITADSHMKSSGHILCAVAENLGISTKSRALLWHAIADRINCKKIIIIGNSQYLTSDMIEILRCFQDFLKGKGHIMGICLTGMGIEDNFSAQISGRIKRKIIYKNIRSDYTGIDKKTDM